MHLSIFKSVSQKLMRWLSSKVMPSKMFQLVPTNHSFRTPADLVVCCRFWFQNKRRSLSKCISNKQRFAVLDKRQVSRIHLTTPFSAIIILNCSMDCAFSIYLNRIIRICIVKKTDMQRQLNYLENSMKLHSCLYVLDLSSPLI